MSVCIHCSSSRQGNTIGKTIFCSECGLPKRKTGRRFDRISQDECIYGHHRAFLGVGELSDAEIEHYINRIDRPRAPIPEASINPVSGAVYSEMAVV